MRREASRLREELLAITREYSGSKYLPTPRESAQTWRAAFIRKAFAKRPDLLAQEDFFLELLGVSDAPTLEAVAPSLEPCLSRYQRDVFDYFACTSSFPTADRPGRRLKFILRDVAQANHPVMGVACLSSAVAHISAPDQWI